MSSPEIPSFGVSSIYVKCPAGMRQEFFAMNPNLKQGGEETLLLVFAADLPEQPLISVLYSFVSKAPHQDLVRAIARQFRIPDACETANNKPEWCYRDGLQLWMPATNLDPEGWNLSLIRESESDYLHLSDQRLVEAENAAGMERAKVNEAAPMLEVKP